MLKEGRHGGPGRYHSACRLPSKSLGIPKQLINGWARFGGPFLCYERGMTDDSPQSDKSKEIARAQECDNDPERFRERVGKPVKD
jgi:hypothetical protein